MTSVRGGHAKQVEAHCWAHNEAGALALGLDCVAGACVAYAARLHHPLHSALVLFTACVHSPAVLECKSSPVVPVEPLHQAPSIGTHTSLAIAEHVQSSASVASGGCEQLGHPC